MSVETKRKVVFGLLMGVMMSSVMSLALTYFAIGFPQNFIEIWLPQSLKAFLIATPLVFILAPMLQKLVAKIIPN